MAYDSADFSYHHKNFKELKDKSISKFGKVKMWDKQF